MRHTPALNGSANCNSLACGQMDLKLEHDLRSTLGIEACPVIRSAADVAAAFHAMALLEREVMVAGTLDRRNRLVCWTIVSSSTADRLVVRVEDVFFSVIKNHGAAIFLVQNHPTGKLSASHSEREIMNRVLRASRLLGYPLLDHVIVTQSGYRSLFCGPQPGVVLYLGKRDISELAVSVSAAVKML